jgi:hypothetical protein
MELRLQQLIEDFERVSNVRNLDPNNPIVMRISHPTNATVHVIVCALTEPHRLVLPLNVAWFVYDPQHAYYRCAMRRVSKDPNVAAGTVHTWQRVDLYDDVFVEQYYDDADTAQLTDNTGPPPASTSELGIARISVPAAVSSNPIVVVNTDPRLADARQPLAHTHPEIPATQLRTTEGVVTISGSGAPEVGAVLIALSANSAEWRKLRSTDLR